MLMGRGVGLEMILLEVVRSSHSLVIARSHGGGRSGRARSIVCGSKETGSNLLMARSEVGRKAHEHCRSCETADHGEQVNDISAAL